MMNNETLIDIVNMINVVVCLFIIIIIIWQSVTKKTPSKVLLILMASLFALLIWAMISPVKLTPYVLLFVLCCLLYVIINYFKLINRKVAPSKKIIYKDNAQLIAQAQEQERSRIYANLHDDVGAKLLELVYSAQDDTTKNLAKEVLHDIRQAVASTQNIQCTVMQLVDELIAESHSRLEPIGIAQSASVSVLNNNKKLAIIVPSVISRILREVISNIIKHAQATKIQIYIVSTDELLNIRIEDDGIGFSQNNKSGKGLKTIRKRAQSIAAEVKWQSKPNDGTTFILSYKYGNKKRINH